MIYISKLKENKTFYIDDDIFYASSQIAKPTRYVKLGNLKENLVTQ